jgi:hypothetical protein
LAAASDDEDVEPEPELVEETILVVSYDPPVAVKCCLYTEEADSEVHGLHWQARSIDTPGFR